MSNKNKYFFVEYIFTKTSGEYNSNGKEIYLCKNEEKTILKINEIINKINDNIKDMINNENIKYDFCPSYYEDYCVNKITTIKKFKLNNYYYSNDDYGFHYEIRVKEVYNNDGIITIQK